MNSPSTWNGEQESVLAAGAPIEKKRILDGLDEEGADLAHARGFQDMIGTQSVPRAQKDSVDLILDQNLSVAREG